MTIENKLIEALCFGPLNQVKDRIRTVAAEVSLEHETQMRHSHILLAKIGLAIMKQASDTLWLSNAETIVEAIFNECEIEIQDSTEEGYRKALETYVREHEGEKSGKATQRIRS